MATVRVSDLIDIAILAFLIYHIFWFMRKTSSGRVLKGIMVLILTMGLASSIQLTATSWLLNRVVEWGILVLVILFQPEIRRALERMGSGKLASVFSSQRPASSHDLESAIRQTVEAYTDLSRDKVGALMVFERRDLLDDVIKTGTPLDCSVTGELLKNLFWNKAPLHDGAVIVRGERIVADACILQLTDDHSLSRELGTRHRAAIGITESTDAVSVIVSEETGIISMARDGKLTRYLDTKSLNILLTELFMPDDLPPAWLSSRSSLIGARAVKQKEDGDEE